MKKCQINGYSLYVQETYKRRLLKGELVRLVPLYESLDPSWRALSDAARQDYKDRAKEIREHEKRRESNALSPQNSADLRRTGSTQDDSNNGNLIESKECSCDECNRRWESLWLDNLEKGYW